MLSLLYSNPVYVIVASCLMLLMPAAAPGAQRSETYYVSAGGSDTGRGTLMSPFASIQLAVSLASPGDTVVVRDGIYGRAGCRSDEDFAVNIATAGTDAAPIRVIAEHKWKAVLDAERVCHSYINLGAGAAHIEIAGFVITGGTWAGVWSNSTAHHIVLRGNRFENIGTWRDTPSSYGIAGFYTGALSHHITIDGNVFHDLGRRTGTANHDHALYLHGSDFVIVNNVFYNITRGWAIQSAEGFRNALIAHNTFALPNPARDGHILLWGAGQANILIRNNLFWRPRGSAIAYCNAAFTGTNSIDHNLAYGVAAVVGGEQCLLSTGAGAIAQTANRIADPLFVDPAAADFRLLPASPAVGAGLPLAEVQHDFDGGSRGAVPSLGAFEFVASGIPRTGRPVRLRQAAQNQNISPPKRSGGRPLSNAPCPAPPCRNRR